MPHLEHSKEELGQLHPSIPAPRAVDDGDPQAEEREPLLEEGLGLAKDLVKTVEEQGRRRRLAEYADRGRPVAAWVGASPRGSSPGFVAYHI